MSFSVKFTGTPAQIKEHIASEASALSGQSQKEFVAVRPALETLLDQNMGGGKLTLVASGHATFENEQRVTGRVRVELRDALADESHESDVAEEETPLSPRGRSRR